MHSRLRIYVESLFDGVKRTREVVELREEILQNVIDKYEDLIREGKSEEDAYHTAISGIGDINDLLRSMGMDVQEKSDMEKDGERYTYDGSMYGKTRPRYRRTDDSMVENFKEWNSNNQQKKAVYKSIRSAVWSVTTALYIIISFMTMAWHITWVIFLIAGAALNVIKAWYDMRD